MKERTRELLERGDFVEMNETLFKEINGKFVSACNDCELVLEMSAFENEKEAEKVANEHIRLHLNAGKFHSVWIGEVGQRFWRDWMTEGLEETARRGFFDKGADEVVE